MVPRSAKLALGATILLWAVAFPSIQVAVAELGPVALAVGRLAVASLALGLLVPFFRLRLPRERGDLLLIGLCAATGMAAYQFLLNTGQTVVPAGTASLLVATVPICSVAIAAVVLREPTRRRTWTGAVVGLAGAALIAVAGGGEIRVEPAALLVLAAALAQATYHTTQKPLLRRLTGFEVAAYATWGGTALMLPFSPGLFAAVPDLSAGAWAAVLFLGVGPSAMGFVTWGYAMARVPVAYATISLYLVPAVAIAVAFVWLRELPQPMELVGGVVTMVGVVVATRPERPARPQTPAGQGEAGQGTVTHR